MALTITIEGKGVITDAEDESSGWFEEGDGSAPGSGTDTYLQGTQSVASKVSGAAAAGTLFYDIGAGNELAFDDSGLLVESLGSDSAWTNIGDTANTLYIAGSWTTGGAYDFIRADIDLKKTGTPSSDLFCEIRVDNSGEPSGSVLATSTTSYTESEISTSQTTYSFDFAAETLSNATDYWIVLRTATSSGSDYYEVRRGSGGNEIDDSPDGTTWSLSTNNAVFFMTLYAQGEDVIGQLVYIWVNVTTLGAIQTLANDGLQIWLGSDDSLGGMTDFYSAWTMAGSDVLRGYTGGWKCYVIDPTTTPTSTGTDPVGLGGIRYFGLYIATKATVFAADNMFVDTIAVGTGLRITGTDVTGWQEISDYCNDYANRAWGMFQEKEGVYYVYGRMYVGDSTQSAATSMIDDSRVMRFADIEYYTGSVWVTAIPDGNNGITVEDQASNITTFQDGVLVGSDAGRSGSVFIGSEVTDTTFDLYGGSAATSLTKLYGTSLQGIDGGISMGDDGDHHVYSVSFSECGQFDPVGAPVLKNTLFINTVATNAALLWNGNIGIEGCGFIANTTGAAIEHTSPTASTYDNLDFSGNTYDVLNSGNASTITAGSFVVGEGYKILTVGSTDYTLIGAADNNIGTKFVATGVGTGTGTATEVLVINKSNGSNPATCNNTGTNADHLFVGSVTVTVTVLDDSTDSGIELAHVQLYLTSDYSTEVLSGATNASGVITDSYSGSTPVDVEGWARNVDFVSDDYESEDISGEITSNGLAITVRLTPSS